MAQFDMYPNPITDLRTSHTYVLMAQTIWDALDYALHGY